jgi:hypothetical protein
LAELCRLSKKGWSWERGLLGGIEVRAGYMVEWP